MVSNVELACVYSALILNDDDVMVTGEKISSLLRASNIEFEPFWPDLFARALEGVNIKDLITSISSTVGSVSPQEQSPSIQEISIPKETEESKDDLKEDSDDGGFGDLFA